MPLSRISGVKLKSPPEETEIAWSKLSELTPEAS